MSGRTSRPQGVPCRQWTELRSILRHTRPGRVSGRVSSARCSRETLTTEMSRSTKTVTTARLCMGGAGLAFGGCALVLRLLSLILADRSGTAVHSTWWVIEKMSQGARRQKPQAKTCFSAQWPTCRGLERQMSVTVETASASLQRDSDLHRRETWLTKARHDVAVQGEAAQVAAVARPSPRSMRPGRGPGRSSRPAFQQLRISAPSASRSKTSWSSTSSCAAENSTHRSTGSSPAGIPLAPC